jgi:hypothetical protein
MPRSAHEYQLPPCSGRFQSKRGEAGKWLRRKDEFEASSCVRNVLGEDVDDVVSPADKRLLSQANGWVVEDPKLLEFVWRDGKE